MEFITPLETLDYWLGRLLDGELREVVVFRPSIVAGANVEMTLRTYGVLLYGRTEGRSAHWRTGEKPDLLGFHVRAGQASWVEELLIRMGVGIVTPLVDERHRKLIDNPGKMPRPWGDGVKAKTPSGHLVSALFALLGGE